MAELMNARWKDSFGGALVALIGAGAMFMSRQYTIGSLREMGPGFFPMALGCILVVIGLALTLRGWIAVPDRESGGFRSDWRGWAAILGGLVAFMGIGDHGGLLPATFAVVAVSAMADRSNSWRDALGLATALVVVCLVLFHWILQVQLPLFSWAVP